jgi:hypothetical protein
VTCANGQGANAARIDRLATHLATLSGPAVMTYDEVVSFLDQAEEGPDPSS